MNYLLLICSDEVPTPEKTAAMRSQIPTWLEEMEGRRVRRLGQRLQGTATAASVRVRDGETLVSDGPFAETKEFVGGFDVIDCADLDEAIEVASKHPVAAFHCVEVRPFADGSAAVPSADSLGPPAPGRERYLLLICTDGIPGSDEEEAAIRRDAKAWSERSTVLGLRVYGHALQGAETATTVRVRDGETLISDGPFAETKEFIGGFDIVDCTSREEAIELAAAHPVARHHVVEVRPFAPEE